MAINNTRIDSKLRSRLGYLAYDEIQDRIDNGLLDQYDVVIVKDQDTVAYVAPDMSIHNVTSRLDAYMSESTAVRALNASPYTYVGMPVAIYHNGSYKLYLVDGEYGDWHVLPAWGNEATDVYYDDIIGAPVLSKVGTMEDIIILNELADGIYAVKGLFRITSESSEIVNSSSYELVVVKENGKYVTRIEGKDTLTYDTSSAVQPSVDRSVTQTWLDNNGYTTDTVVDEMIDEQFNERLEETSSESIQDLFD